MNSQKLREKFLDFFEKKGHKIVPSFSLLPQDSSVLFTTAGMQPFKEYYFKKISPYGNKVASCQKCFRTSDIDQVGDKTHLTFLEMLGNFAFQGAYFKKEAIFFAFEFLVKELNLPISKIWITYFKGEKELPKDEESQKIWQKLGISKEKIFGFGKKENFWGPTGKEGPCGPTTEIHIDLRGKACQKGKNCKPNCDCQRFVELWNLVFNEYYQNEKGELFLLKKKGVDTGMGLERLAMVVQKKESVFETDLFLPLMQQFPKKNFKRTKRIIGDHVKGAVFLISEGILPSNTEEGYILRRILRRAIRFGKILGLKEGFLISLAKKVIAIYQDIYSELKSKEEEILTSIQKEEEKFRKTLDQGLREFEKMFQKGKFSSLETSGQAAFDLYQSYGFPLELTMEMVKEKGGVLDPKGYQIAFEKHKEISRKGAQKKFGGIGIESLKDPKEKEKATKLHTATHLLHQALREVLGKKVRQTGSDITPQRLRFDFFWPQKIDLEKLKKVENLVNQKIKENLKVKKEKMSLKEALKSGALAFFKEKYPQKVTVFTIGNFSKEICAGPHVKSTKELGHFKIIEAKSIGAEIKRIKAILE